MNNYFQTNPNSSLLTCFCFCFFFLCLFGNIDNPVSLSNELRVLRTLFTATSNMLSQFKNSTLDSEIEILTEFQTNRELTETQKPMTRSEVAAHLRLSEKRILMQFRNFIKNQWLSFIDMKYENLSQIDDF